MIIKKLRLNNIRSYVNEDIEFPSGAILFEGDVGSGKTTILISMEFALFGLSSELKADHLLRNGCAKGFVELTLDVAGKELVVRRSLEKSDGKTTQKECYLISDGAREDYSVTEMKSRVLSILGFNEKVHPQASSLIYRYAVFTPQERMKEILSSNADERLETIRRAFMMEEYKTAASNSEDVQKFLRSEIKAAEMSIADLQSLKESVKAYEIEKLDLESEISTLVLQIENNRKELSSVSERIESLRKLKEKHAALSAEIDSLSRTVVTEEKNMYSLSQKSLSSDAKIDTVKGKMKILGEKKTLAAEEIKNGMEFLGIENASILRIEDTMINETRKKIKLQVENALTDITKTSLKIQDLESLIEKGICPVCEQNIDPDHFKSRIEDHSSRLKSVQNLLEEKRRYETAADKIASLVSDMKTINKEAEFLAESYAEEVRRKTEIAEEIEKSIKSITDANRRKDELTGEISGLGLEIGKIADLENKEKSQRKILEDLARTHSAKNQRLADVIVTIERDAERVGRMEAKLENIRSTKECLDWLGAYFTPSVESIESHVFASYNRNFDALFKKWFSMLMDSGEIAVRVDDKFTPIIEQNGYEQDVDALSGGEKTSVALAYRLALNTIVKEIAISLRNNLLILDEPTDGFSKEQLHRMRDILNELQCDQVIIVSHEKELEAFVDNIIEVRKEGSVSKVIKR
ncbi:MAG: SMC family ATPase [Candidatus Aenigmarchaeota archaeon]|nr:SMC family ATPase [Candidatus Aenigmarchaeota archaeon]